MRRSRLSHQVLKRGTTGGGRGGSQEKQRQRAERWTTRSAREHPPRTVPPNECFRRLQSSARTGPDDRLRVNGVAGSAGEELSVACPCRARRTWAGSAPMLRPSLSAIEERTRCSPIWPSTRRSASEAARRLSTSPRAGARKRRSATERCPAESDSAPRDNRGISSMPPSEPSISCWEALLWRVSRDVTGRS